MEPTPTTTSGAKASSKWKCPNESIGCRTEIKTKKYLNYHVKNCTYRAIPCLMCPERIQFDKYLEHLRNVEKLMPIVAPSFSIELVVEDLTQGERLEPLWVNIYRKNYFVRTAYFEGNLYLWMSTLLPEPGKEKCTMALRNEKTNNLKRYTGPVHCVRTTSSTVFAEGSMFMIYKADIKNFQKQGVLPLLVRIERCSDGRKFVEEIESNPPKKWDEEEEAPKRSICLIV